MTDALIALNKAEQALAEATNIIDIMDLRTKAKAVEVVAIAEGFGEVAQQAKIFQLKAERKAGYWLKENIAPGRPKSSQNARIKLDDLEIDYSQSSRWQLMASIPEGKFNGWLDDRLAKGQEITAGGLRNYARNIKGKPVIGSLKGTYALNPQGCALSGYVIPCSGHMTGGHILNRAKARGNKKVRDYLDKPMNINPQCIAHNVGKLADTQEARKIQLLQKIYRHGWKAVKEYYDEIPWKVHHVEFELERMLDA